MYNELRGKIHFWGSMIFFNVAFFPMHVLGLAGMPRRYADYPAQFPDFNQLATDRRVRLRSSAGLFSVLGSIAYLSRGGQVRADAKPWDGAEGLEWTLPSPVPFHTFETPPHVE